MSKSKHTSGDSEHQVIDFTEIRNQKMEEKRKNSERVFINNVLGVYCVTGEHSMHQIEMIDLSEEGCSFQVPFNPEKPFPVQDKDLPIRLYFSQDTYMEIYATIQNSRPSIQHGTRYTRYGCTVDKGTASYAAYQTFVKFLRVYAEVSHKDNGNVSIFFV